ncbi:ParA family protein [Iamia sp. SCSIO 61187]|uniref:ParA family protein n=1 Tax=Iamia sp. SCSIO 61187 TaxID=2722752 RepID=UPI001C631496|nr:ParA family protein [Iamia sp. SCSIO 61187]QYG92877.1 ParA family protein [Iamia sp. SCSIO 61187]
MQSVALTALKGGVGKTSTAVNLAALAAAAGHRTLLWDIDPQAGATACLGVKPKLRGGAQRLLGGDRDLSGAVRRSSIDRLDVLPGDVSLREADVIVSSNRKPRRSLKRILSAVARDYDVVLVDCPPGVGPATEVLVRSVDLLLVPVVPAPLDLRALDRFADVIDDLGAPPELLAPFLSLVDRRKPLHRKLMDEVRTERRFLASAVPVSSAVERMPMEQVPTVIAAPRSLASLALRDLWGEVADRIDL